jgi:hypothetical protein
VQARCEFPLWSVVCVDERRKCEVRRTRRRTLSQRKGESEKGFLGFEALTASASFKKGKMSSNVISNGAYAL